MSARATAGGRSRGLRVGAIGVAFAAGGSLIVAAILLTAACVTSASLTARSVLRTGMPTVATAIRTDAYQQFAERIDRTRPLIDLPESTDTDSGWQLASVDSRPAGLAGACRGAAEKAGAPPSLAAVTSSEFAAPPCLTGDDLRAVALVPSAARLEWAPVLAMSVPGNLDRPQRTSAPDHTGSITTASLPPAPEARPRRDDLRGYPASLAVLDGRTAVYDIVNHTVYLPDGTRLEAHSGLGAKRDDPRHVHVRMQGATPPNVYDLRLREALFHGVRAIRLTPSAGSKMFGRDGILAHTYMLGPNGQSNGCVSFRNYPAFLQAFLKGEVKRLVVVASLPAPPTRAMLRGLQSDQVALNSQ